MKKTDFTRNWVFYKDGSTEQQTLDLPHDAMLFEQRRANNASTGACANFDGGRYHYEKRFVASEAWADKHLELFFEGVYRNSKVLLNGEELGGCRYGYSSFSVQLNKALRLGEQNLLEVLADNSETPNSRWYSGSGIYRPVWLLIGERSHIAWQGIRIHTVSIAPPTIHVEVEHRGGEVEIYVEKDGTVLASGTGDQCDIVIPGASLWSDETPALYDCRVRLLDNGRCVDEAVESFGIREIKWSSKGLFVNGKETLLRGGCVHADNGILGAKSYREAEWRRVRKLKELGFTAIRSSHNPAAEEMLRACDHYGVYVMDETWDMWYSHKSRFDYASDFEENWRFDLESMVRKDYNHPSVLMYSIGNEVAEPAKDKGMDTARQLIAALHELDSTRPVTGGINLMILVQAAKGKGIYKEDGSGTSTGSGTQVTSSMLFNMMTAAVGSSMNKAANSAKADQVTTPILDALDIAGYNYASGRYPKEGKLHPDRLIFGSETYIPDLPKNWAMVKKYPWVIGDFMWTAWDYMGEAGAGAWAYTKDGFGFEKPYPWLLADMGVLDILGNPNGEAFLTAAVWGKLKGPRIAVQPVNQDHRPAKSSWRCTDAIPSWSWEGCENKPATVEVYADAHHVELLLNGRVIGQKRIKDFKASFKLKYQPGELKARAFDRRGNQLGEDRLLTASGRKTLRISPEQIVAKPGQVAFFQVEIVGENGVVESNSNHTLQAQVTGGTLLGFGSANPRTEESFVSGCYTSYYGRAQAIVKAGENGEITLCVEGDGLKAECRIQIER